MNAKIINGKIDADPEGSDSGDGKRMFFVADNNDGWQDLRLELSTDDCDKNYAKQWMNRICQCVEHCRGMALPVKK